MLASSFPMHFEMFDTLKMGRSAARIITVTESNYRRHENAGPIAMTLDVRYSA